MELSENKNKKRKNVENIMLSDGEGQVEEPSNLKGDYGNVMILLFLYILQGVPLGISSAVRILLQNRGVSFKEQALYSLSSYPFTSKLNNSYRKQI